MVKDTLNDSFFLDLSRRCESLDINICKADYNISPDILNNMYKVSFFLLCKAIMPQERRKFISPDDTTIRTWVA